MSEIDEAIAAVEGEIDYQNQRWNADTTSTAGVHSTGEFVGFILDYTLEANKFLSRNAEPEAGNLARHNLRKIAAMAIKALAQNGVAFRVYDPTPLPPPPLPGSRWRHRNGNVYEVLLITNKDSDRAAYPPTVVYINVENHKVYSRVLRRWTAKSFTPA